MNRFPERRFTMRAILLALTLVCGALPAVADMTAPASSGAVTHLSAADVTAAFEKGRPLVEVDAFKIHASRREGPGKAEVHVRDTDVIYVLEGSATIVTGGSVDDQQTVAPDELRGTSITNGESRALRKGDVMVVPNGVPHWFRDVNGPLLYYVVKVTAPAGGTR
jgi:glc operon protein GlcG